ncbi:MAG: phosphate ABC transporter, permease protein PstA, partial [Nevskiales bacterium]
MNTATQTAGVEARLTTQEESGLKLWWKSGAPWVWLNAAAVAVSIILVLGLLGLIAARGLGHFWPNQVMLTTYAPPGQSSQIVLGEEVNAEEVTAARLQAAGVQMGEPKDFYVRYLVKTGNRDVSGADFVYVMQDWLGEVSYPENILVVERREWGNLYGTLQAVKEADRVVASGENAW